MRRGENLDKEELRWVCSGTGELQELQMEENILKFAEVEPVAKRTRRANAGNNKINSASNNQSKKRDREAGSSSSGRKPVAQYYYRRAKANNQSQNQNHPRNGAATGNVNRNNANGKKNSHKKRSDSSSKTARNRRRKAIYNRRTSECAKAVLVLLMRGLQAHKKRRGSDCSSSISPESDLTRCFHQFIKAEIRRQYVNLSPSSSPDSSSTPAQSACVSKSRDVALVGVEAEDEEIRQPDDTFGNLVFEVIQGKETQFEEEEEEEDDRDNYDGYDDDDDERKSEAEAAEGMETTVQSPEGGNAWEEEKKDEFGDLQETQKLAIMPLPESQSIAYCNIYDCNLSNCNNSNSEAGFYKHLLPSASQQLKEPEDEADASKMEPEPENICLCTRVESSVQQDSQGDNAVYCNFGSFSATELSLVPAYPSAEHLSAAPDNSHCDRTPN